MPKYFVFLFVFTTLSLLSFGLMAQRSDLIELTGFVKDFSQKPIPYVRVAIVHKGRMTATDNRGMFSIVVQPKDTLLFSCLGYKNMKIFIPDTVKEQQHNVEIHLVNDTIMMDAITIFPYQSYDEFKQAFIALKLPQEVDKEVVNMENNLMYIRMQIIASQKDIALPSTSFRLAMQPYFERNALNGMYRPNPLLNVFNWAQFIKAMQDGSLFRSSKQVPKND
jgi:hypothetical protein